MIDHYSNDISVGDIVFCIYRDRNSRAYYLNGIGELEGSIGKVVKLKCVQYSNISLEEYAIVDIGNQCILATQDNLYKLKKISQSSYRVIKR